MESISVDPVTQRIFHNGQSLRLTKTEFRIVQVLAKARGQVRTRESIFEDIYWDRIADEDHPYPEIIAVLVSRIRPRLGSIGLNIPAGLGGVYRLVKMDGVAT